MAQTVFVSGCFEILHAGHIEFLRSAKALGDRLIVSVAGDAVLWQHKRRVPVIPVEHRVAILKSFSFVDRVVVTEPGIMGLDFEPYFRQERPSILAVTEDDKYTELKVVLCHEVGARYVVLPKATSYERLSTSDVRRRLAVPVTVPLRVDFAGGWLDVPALSKPGAFVVNCATTPLVSLSEWPYPVGAGLGGSAARAILEGRSALESELAAGVGWQDPAVICETGLCVWRSGTVPELEFKSDGRWLQGCMAILQVGPSHHTPSLVNRARPYDEIHAAGAVARDAVCRSSLDLLAQAVEQSYHAQLEEGMLPLGPHGALARKYCGAGWGGFALFLFGSPEQREKFMDAQTQAIRIEPHCQVRALADVR